MSSAIFFESPQELYIYIDIGSDRGTSFTMTRVVAEERSNGS